MSNPLFLRYFVTDFLSLMDVICIGITTDYRMLTHPLLRFLVIFFLALG
jgi:hypothetical protein